MDTIILVLICLCGGMIFLCFMYLCIGAFYDFFQPMFTSCDCCQIFKPIKNTLSKINPTRNTKIKIQKNKVLPKKKSKKICSICLEELIDSIDIIDCCQCGHCFHKKCIQEWLKTHSTCPNCRQSCRNLYISAI